MLTRAPLSETLEKQTTTLGLQNGELEKTDLVTAFLILCGLWAFVAPWGLALEGENAPPVAVPSRGPERLYGLCLKFLN